MDSDWFACALGEDLLECNRHDCLHLISCG
jgi:hypothetical protein